MGFEASDFVLQMGEALQPHVGLIRRIFKMFASMGSGVQSATEMNKSKFGNFCRNVGIMDGKKSDGTSNGCAKMNGGEVLGKHHRASA